VSPTEFEPGERISRYVPPLPDYYRGVGAFRPKEGTSTASTCHLVPSRTASNQPGGEQGRNKGRYVQLECWARKVRQKARVSCRAVPVVAPPQKIITGCPFQVIHQSAS
jgi:hypothetical protein